MRFLNFFRNKAGKNAHTFFKKRKGRFFILHFRRSFFLTLSIIVLFLVLIFAFELINLNISESGFSSGEVFVFSFDEGVFSGEFFGRKFSFDFSVFGKILPVFGYFFVLLPPFLQLLLRFLPSVL